MGRAQRDWANALSAWAIPDEILEQAPESPWGFPVALFTPDEHILHHADNPSSRAALASLPPAGSVLDVGSGPGAPSLPLAARAGSITAVDQSRDMLDSFASAAERLGVRHEEVQGTWPDVASDVGPHDVVVCHHVFYNVADLGPFVIELTRHARRRVVVEITATHPAANLKKLWRHFHNLERPTGPGYADAVAVLEEIGIAPSVERWTRPNRRASAPRAEVVAFARRRLCLPAERDREIDAVLDDQMAWAPTELVTLSWPGEHTSKETES